MSQPTWSDFVQWVANERDFAVPSESAMRYIRGADSARVALAMCALCDAQTFDESLTRFTTEHGAPVDPPDPLREKLEALAGDLDAESSSCTEDLDLFGESRPSAESIALHSAAARLRAILETP